MVFPARALVFYVQRFHGEDLTAPQRKAEQTQQCLEWWKSQSDDLQAARDREKLEREQLGDLTRYYDAVQQAAVADERAAARGDDADLANSNAELAATRRQIRASEKALQDEQNRHEIQCALDNPMLSEDPQQAKSYLSAGRVRKDHWKGMNDDEKRSILETQFKQVEDSKDRRQKELAREAEWARVALATDKAIKEQQRQADDFRRRQELDRLAFLKAQRAEKEARDARLNDVYANKATGAYFAQFGTSHR
jgi:hypothetical protein